MPKANLRVLPPYDSFQEWKCSVCKTTFSLQSHSVRDENSVRALKAALFKEWDEHLRKEHRRQWDAEQAKKAKRAKRQRS
jgi:transposase-like protein